MQTDKNIKQNTEEMKKAMFFACAALSLAMLSCSGGEAKSSENAEAVVKEVEDSATIIGKWADASQKGFELVDDSSTKTIGDGTEYLEWAVNENNDTLTLITATDTLRFGVQFSGDKLTLTDGEGKTTEYTRQ